MQVILIDNHWDSEGNPSPKSSYDTMWHESLGEMRRAKRHKGEKRIYITYMKKY